MAEEVEEEVGQEDEISYWIGVEEVSLKDLRSESNLIWTGHNMTEYTGYRVVEINAKKRSREGFPG